jgi:hypothetical protein
MSRTQAAVGLDVTGCWSLRPRRQLRPRTGAHAAARIVVELRDPALEPLLRKHLTVENHDEIVRVCRDVLAPDALPAVREMADGDDRVIRYGEPPTLVWRRRWCGATNATARHCRWPHRPDRCLTGGDAAPDRSGAASGAPDRSELLACKG